LMWMQGVPTVSVALGSTLAVRTVDATDVAG